MKYCLLTTNNTYSCIIYTMQSTDADTEAARAKLMKQRAEEKRAREREIIERQNELKVKFSL